MGINNVSEASDGSLRGRRKSTLTPANQRSQAPGQRVKPHHEYGQGSSSFGVPLYCLQRLGDDQVTVDGDGQQVYHGGDAEQGSTERIHLTAYRGRKEHTEMSQQENSCSSNAFTAEQRRAECVVLENKKQMYPSLQTPILCRDS